MLWKKVIIKSDKQEYKNNYINISNGMVNHSTDNSEIRCSKNNRHRKDMIAAKHELQEIKDSIDAVRDRLNKIASRDEQLKLTEEIIEVSRQLDILIQDYNRKSIEIQKMYEIKNYNLNG